VVVVSVLSDPPVALVPPIPPIKEALGLLAPGFLEKSASVGVGGGGGGGRY
jgi:hypothetical protein